MAIIYTYPTKTNPVGDDLILISDSADSNKTKQVKVSALPSSGGGSVTSVGFSLSSLAAFAITGDNPVTGSGTITLGINGSPSSGYLDYQGNWTTPTDTSYSAGDGLDLTGTTFSADLKANSGLVIDTTELSLNLGASAITGTLAVANGGTGRSTLTTGNVLVGNATSSVTLLNTAVKGTIVVGEAGAATTLAVGTDGHVLTAASSEGVGVRWTAPVVDAANITGSLAVGKGGTGATTLTGLLKGNGTGAVTGGAGLNNLSDVSFASTANGSLYVGQISSQLSGTPVGNVTLGGGAAKVATTAFDNTLVGSDAAIAITEGNANIAIGSDVAATLTTGTNNVIIGDSANIAGATLSSTTVVGQGASGAADSTVVGKGATASTNGIAIGSGATAAGGGIAIGKDASAAANEIELNGITSSIVGQVGSSNNGQLKITINGTVYYIQLLAP